MPALESLYLEAVPTGHTPSTMDPVYNHGHQVRESYTHFRRSYDSKDLLGKVLPYSAKFSRCTIFADRVI